MRIAFDTNIVLDAIIEGREGGANAKQLILAVAQDRAEGLISANSITDIYYIARKYLGDLKTREVIYSLLTIFSVAGVGEDDCLSALELPMGDFEDALLAVCSQRDGAEYIVTRDEGFIAAQDCPVKTVRPDMMLSILQG